LSLIIDFHTHCFPDSLAEKAINKLMERAQNKPYTDGTLKDTYRILDEWNTDYAVSCNIAVLPKSVAKVNDFAIVSDGGRIISFGSAHPFADNSESELERIKAAGLKGIKLHPEYQDFDVHIPEAIKIYKKCAQLDLIVLIHSGKDIAYPDSLRAAPEYLREISVKSPYTKFVFAHMGGEWCWEGVIKYVAGLDNVWLDTAYSACSMDREMFKRVAEKHGLDKILYATDLPWDSGINTQQYINNMGYTKEEKDGIMYLNALKLLGGINGCKEKV
jgi:predicted TIM-barrel fold metal-dependent hydrolase